MQLTISLTDDTIDKLANAINKNREMDKESLYTLKELARILNVSENTLYKKKLPYVTMGDNSRKLYNKYQVIDYLRR